MQQAEASVTQLPVLGPLGHAPGLGLVSAGPACARAGSERMRTLTCLHHVAYLTTICRYKQQ
eukprot:1138107-Pelagomonas_calceolata.AAC.1